MKFISECDDIRVNRPQSEFRRKRSAKSIDIADQWSLLVRPLLANSLSTAHHENAFDIAGDLRFEHDFGSTAIPQMG